MMRSARMAAVLVAASGAFGFADGPKVDQKAVLVELFVSQGCDMCPSAETVLGKLASSERVIPIAFHVDFFDDPWKDPYSDPKFSIREAQYSEIYNKANKLNNPGVLYLTPLLMVDGRIPLLGTDDSARNHKALPKGQEAIRKALAEKPGVRIRLALDGKPEDASRNLSVDLTPLSSATQGREVLVQVVPFEDRAVTKVERGELKGKTYSGQFVARGLTLKETKLARSGKTTVSVPIAFPSDANPRKGGVVVIVQDNDTGRVHQAAKIRWEPASP